MKKASYLVDFLKSFELILEIEELTDDKSQTLLDHIIPTSYKQAILDYTRNLKQAAQGFQRFVTEDYNLLLLFLYSQKEINDIDTYIQSLEQLTQADFIQLLENQFEQTNLQGSPTNLDKLPIQSTSKWYLFSLMNDFPYHIKRLIFTLKQQYEVYCFYANTICERYATQIQQLENQLTQSNQLYSLIFKDILTLEEYQQGQQFFVLLLSSHQLLIYYKKPHQFIAIGLHVYDYYLAVEKQKALDTVTMQNVLKVLSDPTRYGIMKCIEKGMTSNKEIAKVFSISPSGVTYQTKFLLENQILLIDPETKRYKLNKELVKLALITVLSELNIALNQPVLQVQEDEHLNFPIEKNE